MSKYGARRSPWRIPVLMLKFMVSSSEVNITADVFTYIICMAMTIFYEKSYEWRIRTTLFQPRESKAFILWFLISQ